MTHDTPKRRGPKPGSGKGATTISYRISIRLDQVEFWDGLPNRSAFVQAAIDEAIERQAKIPAIEPGTYTVKLTESFFTKT